MTFCRVQYAANCRTVSVLPSDSKTYKIKAKRELSIRSRHNKPITMHEWSPISEL